MLVLSYPDPAQIFWSAVHNLKKVEILTTKSVLSNSSENESATSRNLSSDRDILSSMVSERLRDASLAVMYKTGL